MPGMNARITSGFGCAGPGLEAARKLKVTMPSLPLLMFTNHIGSILEYEARAAGITVVVSKAESALFFHADALLS